MKSEKPSSARIQATVQEVLPLLGLAYVVDDRQRTWGVTRVTPGSGLDSLKAGAPVELEVCRFESFALVERYSALN
jgi:hypothetical protein